MLYHEHTSVEGSFQILSLGRLPLLLDAETECLIAPSGRECRTCLPSACFHTPFAAKELRTAGASCAGARANTAFLIFAQLHLALLPATGSFCGWY